MWFVYYIVHNFLGKYAFIEASDNFGARRYRGDDARLVSPSIMLPKACFTLDYHMYGRDMGSLKIKVQYGKKENVLWEKSGNQGNEWKRLETSIESVTDYKVSEYHCISSTVLLDMTA